MAKEYVLDGTKVTSLETFYDEIGNALHIGSDWGRNLDALDDVLSGGDLGIPDDGFVLTWTGSQISRNHLGYRETVRQLEKHLRSCHPANRQQVRAQLEEARQGKGRTVFDWLVGIIGEHQETVRLVLA